MDEKSIMVNLGDERIKEISEVIGNKTCNKILDYLSETEATVTDLSNELKMPLNTVDYNVKKLVKSGLIEKASHWWSVKGKKMPVYKVSNKKIIISPKKKVARNFLLAFGLTGIMAWVVNLLTKPKSFVLEKGSDLTFDAAPMATESAINAVREAPEMPMEFVSSAGFFSSLGPASWFLIGAWFAIVLFMMITIIKDRRNNK